MRKHAQRLVAVLCEHPLLGEGIAQIILIETGAEVAVAQPADRRALQAALARDPDVVIFECGHSDVDVARLAPRAILIDVSAAMGSDGRGPVTTDLGAILLAVRGR